MTGERRVIYASPLILLRKLQRLDLLTALTASVAIPESVFAEVASGQGKDATTAATLTWADSRRVPDVPVPVTVANRDLGPGESQVIAHALAGPLLPVLDDGEARACALSHSLPMIGTLGIVLRARKQGLIPVARPLVEQILAAGSFLNEESVEGALAQVGE